MVGEWIGVGLAGALLAFALLQYLFITLSNASTYDRLFRVPKHTHLVMPYCLNYFVSTPSRFCAHRSTSTFRMSSVCSALHLLCHVLLFCNAMLRSLFTVHCSLFTCGWPRGVRVV